MNARQLDQLRERLAADRRSAVTAALRSMAAERRKAQRRKASLTSAAQAAWYARYCASLKVQA